MADRVVLHIGTMKSGTTYLQAVLTSGILEEAGGFYPGEKFGVQTGAVRRLMRPEEQRNPRPWRALADEACERPGVAVFSQEFLSFFRRSRVRHIVSSFGGIPVEVVLTVRDQRGVIPAQWQSFTRNQGRDDLATYVDRVRASRKRQRRSKAARSFWLAQNVPGILDRWTGHDGITSVTVVVVPPPGSPPAELWRRFCDAAGLEAHDPPAAALPANESLGYASCEALRRINVQLGDLGKRRYRTVRDDLLEVLLPLRPEEDRPRLDRSALALAADLNRDIVDAVAHHQVRVVGSLDELPVDPVEEGSDTLADPEPAQVRRALETAWRVTVTDRPPPGGSLEDLAAGIGRHVTAG